MEKQSLTQAELNQGLKRFAQYYNSQTNIGTFRSTVRSSLLNEGLSTRANSIWKMAQYIIATHDSSNKPKQDYLAGWKTLAANVGNQYLFLETTPNIWELFDASGNLLGDNQYIVNFLDKKALEKQQEARVAIASPQRHVGNSLQLICYGAPGTGKSHLIDEMIDDENAIRTTFHPDTDYASFVGAYKPTMEPMPIHAIVGMDAKHARGENGEKAYEQKIVYKYVPQGFLKAYVAAWSNLEKPFYLVIEEINRGNCAQIFGDLFQLLDRNNTGSSSYPIHADEDIQRFLASDAKGFAGLTEEKKENIRNFTLHKDNGKIVSIGEDLLNGTKLLLPPNLHLWATMNTSDQSLFPIDSAFKRRWSWKYIPIDYDKGNWTFAIGERHYSWGDFLRKINQEIYTLTESADKQMGYYFVKADPQNGIITEDVFVNKVLFYLWTDVFKDYDISSDLFRDKDQNRPFRFSDFFEKDSKALANFIEGLNLVSIGKEETDNTEDFLPDENDDSPSRDMSKYSINGSGVYNKRKTVLHSLELYIQNYPNLSDEEIIENWQDLNSGHKNFMETEDVFNARTADNVSQKIRSEFVQRPNGSKIYIKNQWGGARFNDFVHAFNKKDWGITITKIQE